MASSAPFPAPLQANIELLDVAELALARTLVACGQAHLFDDWEPPGEHDDEKHAFFDRVAALDAAYAGGLPSYIEAVRAAPPANAPPLADWTSLEPAEGVHLTPLSEEYLAFEEHGLLEAVHLAFVVSAGEIGSAFGSSEVAVGLPSEICSGASVLQLYCHNVRAGRGSLDLTSSDSFVGIPPIARFVPCMSPLR